MSSSLHSARLIELAHLFLKLGTIGFGGPNAHIAMMEEEVVVKRQWLRREEFLDLIGATNLIPGPNSTEIAIHVGYLYAGWLGLIVAGVCFILPAVLITLGFAWAYVALGALPQLAFLLYGIKPAVLAIVVDALWRLGKKAVKNRILFAIALIVILLVWFARVSEIIALLLGGFLGMLWLKTPHDRSNEQANLLITGLTLTSALKATAAVGLTTVPFSLWQLGWTFLKIGSVLFGGGYVLIAFIQGSFVDNLGWLTQQQLFDAIAIGQFTPGPILSTATFIGYVIGGIPGAIVSTIGIFLPSFVFVVVLNPVIPLLRRSEWASAFLDAVNVSAVGLMVVVTVQLAIATLGKPTAPFIDVLATMIALMSALLAIRFRVSAVWLVLGGAAIAWAASWLGYL